MRALLESNRAVAVPSVERAESLPARMLGLMFAPALEPGRALHITPCPSVHTFFMRFALDLVFLDRSGCVVRIVRNVGPFRIVFGGLKAHSVLELASGWLPETALKPGDRLLFESERAHSLGE